jgi:hypothetical protein
VIFPGSISSAPPAATRRPVKSRAGIRIADIRRLFMVWVLFGAGNFSGLMRPRRLSPIGTSGNVTVAGQSRPPRTGAESSTGSRRPTSTTPPTASLSPWRPPVFQRQRATRNRGSAGQPNETHEPKSGNANHGGRLAICATFNLQQKASRRHFVFRKWDVPDREG